MGESEKQYNSQEQLEQIKQILRLVNDKVDKQDARIKALEQVAGKMASIQETPQQIKPAPLPPDKFLFAEKKEENPSIAKHDSPGKTPVPKPAMEFEERIGANFFSKIGIVALVLGVSFFLKYAFDNNWINETGRVFIGLLSGLVLLGIGEKTIKKYKTYGQVVSGGGLAVLYLSIYAALNFYGLISNFPAFVFMAFVTAGGIALSLRYESVGLIGFSLIGGFATPFLVSSAVNEQVQLFGYILILDLAILFISYFRKWRKLNLIGYVGTALVYIFWHGKYYSEDQLISTFVFLTLFFLIYSMAALLFNLKKKEASSGTEQSLTLLAAAGFFAAGYVLLSDKSQEARAIFSLLLALYYLGWAYLVSQATPDDESLYSFMAFLSVTFVTLFIPIQFDKNIITIGWALEALVLIFINTRTKNRTSLLLGMVVYCFVFFRLMFIDSRMIMTNDLFLINERFFTYLAVIAISYLAAYLMHFFRDETPPNQKMDYRNAFAILLIVANLLTIFSVSQEIVLSYGRRISEIESTRTRYNQRQLQKTPGVYDKYQVYSDQNQLDAELIKKVRNQRDIALSSFWLVYAIIVLVVGFVGKYKIVRVGGILLLLLAIFKLFFYDLWSLGTLYRIISSISLGIVLLSISFVYQRYKDKIKEIIED